MLLVMVIAFYVRVVFKRTLDKIGNSAVAISAYSAVEFYSAGCKGGLRAAAYTAANKNVDVVFAK